jgi:acyl transferase domain-containing protein
MMRQKDESSMSTSQEPNKFGVAIVGLAGRFPGAGNVKKFWQNLAEGVESIHFASDEELAAAGVPAELSADADFVRASSTVEEPEFFDAGFFGFSARQAEIIDPQQRVFLECAWQALEDAACDPYSYAGAIGVFAGTGMNTYALVNLFSNPDLIQSLGGYQAMIGNDKDFLCSRVSYKLNLKGTSVGVQTACSTSLVAVQMAFESLRRRECDMALAGGVSIAIPQPAGYRYVPGMILSKDGHCRAFDADASGTVPGAGAGVVALKRLDDALAEGDHIYAVIRGAAINNDGSAKAGYTAPSVEGQTAAIRKAMQMAGFAPESIGYIEAHGTGTEVGDPIEVTALTEAFKSDRAKSRSCALGSLKTNLGHLDAAAGVAGLIKATLAIQHRAIPPTLHFQKPNPLIDFSRTPFYVNNEAVPYDRPEPFRAGVCSFGIGGPNAHVSIEEPPAVESSFDSNVDSAGAAQLFVLSAKTTSALEKRSADLAAYVEENSEANLADIAYTLQKGRRSFDHRRIVVARNTGELKERLLAVRDQSAADRALRNGGSLAEPVGVAFLFPGQGSQYVNMGLDLYRTVPSFRETVDRCSEILKPHLGLDLRDLLYPPAGSEKEAEHRLGQTAITQPALFTIEYAMAQLWIDCGVHPAAMLGHSIGEYVAACLAGVFSLEDALALVAARGRLIQSAPHGTMLAVSLPEHDLEPLLSREVSLGAVNSPGQSVASGPEPAIAALEVALQAKKIECKRLRTSHAFHSPMMDGVVKEFVACVANTPRHAPKLRYLSNTTGAWIADEQATSAEYWGLHLRHAVRFSDCAGRLLRESKAVLLEVGPGETLLSLVRSQAESRGRALIPSMRHRLASVDDRSAWLKGLGRLWLLNERVDWSGLYRGLHRRKLSLPGYPFERQRYYVEPKTIEARPKAAVLQKKPDIADWFYLPSWKRTVPELLPPLEIGPSDTWLLLAEDGEFAGALAENLGAYGQVVRVRTGRGFRRMSRELYEIDPVKREDYAQLLDRLRADGQWPDRIVHAWLASDPVLDLNAAMNRGVLSIMGLVQAIEDLSSVRRVELNLVGDRAYSICGEPAASPAASALYAFGEVAAVESPNITCRRIDLDLRSDTESAAGRLTYELVSSAPDETVAYRGPVRWVRQFEPVRLEAKPDSSDSSPRSRSRAGIALRQGGTYLITGGLGGVGLVFARHLALRGASHLVLTSRTALPPSSEWDSLMESADTPALLKRRIQGIRAVEDAGGAVSILAVDPADREEMRRLVSAVQTEYGAIHGIVHAAGAAGNGMIQTKSLDQAMEVLKPKTEGSEWIRDGLDSPDLDFVLLCSSISAVVPSFGLSDYAAANAYLDGLAAIYDDPSGTRVIAANFDTWREVGMAVDAELPEHLAQLRADRLKHGILSREAEKVFDRLLQWPVPQVVVSTRDFNLLRRQTEEAVAQMRSSASLPGAVPSSTGDVDSGAGAFSDGNGIERFIVELWQELLGVAPIGVDDNFFELGGHSLLGTQVLARLRERYKVDVTLRTIFEAATPAELARHIHLLSWASGSPVEDSAMEREEIEI